jgi:hypothetical protein
LTLGGALGGIRLGAEVVEKPLQFRHATLQAFIVSAQLGIFGLELLVTGLGNGMLGCAHGCLTP